ncbi:MAG: translation initiation factor IF-2 [Spirochaetaceae bacterium]|nr:translation initiation factor IF-2 [Spirochaetaceae bacterium]
MAEKNEKGAQRTPEDETESKPKPKVTLIKKRPEPQAASDSEPARPPVKRKVVIRRRPIEVPARPATPPPPPESPAPPKPQPRKEEVPVARPAAPAKSGPRIDPLHQPFQLPKRDPRPVTQRPDRPSPPPGFRPPRGFRPPQGLRPPGQRGAPGGPDRRTPDRPLNFRPPQPGRGPGRPPMGPGGGSGPPPSPGRGPGRSRGKPRRRGQYSRERFEEHAEKLVQQRRREDEAAAVPGEIDIMEQVTVSELARKMNLKASSLIAKLMEMGSMVTINQQIDSDTATVIAEQYNCTVNVVSLYHETVIESEQPGDADDRPRPPIVTIMGHVDHGKTKLMDAIREANVADQEHGGITQHIGAYAVSIDRDSPTQGRIVFLDTPGHEAFTNMRARGAQVTDIVVLVVAADDGTMPQTVEAISHAREAEVPIIVAVNKCDLEDANPERVKQQLSDHELVPEEWGGDTLYREVSALAKTGIDELLEAILLQADLLELHAPYDVRAEGRVIESKVDLGRGTVGTVLIERGTLRSGDPFIAGVYPGKVRAMFDDLGNSVKEATPSLPVEILGFSGLPAAGDPFQVTADERTARTVGDKRQELRKVREAGSVSQITLDNLYETIKEGEVQELKVVAKGDVHGSVEALVSALERLSTDDIKLTVIHSSAGAINENDVMLASASNALIIGFHIRPTPKAQELADQEKVEIRRYDLIYEAVEEIRDSMEGMLTPEVLTESVGVAEVRELFRISRLGTIAGCHVTSGHVRRNAMVHVVRDGAQVYEGRILTLRRFKEDVNEVEAGFECGIRIENFNDLKQGDSIEAFETKEVAKKL